MAIKKRWTQAEKEFLLNNFDKMANAELAAALGRSIHAVRLQCAQLGLRRSRRKNKITIKSYNPEYKPGDMVRVTWDRGQQRQGRVLRVYERFILIQFPRWRECVNIATLISGDVKIELVERRKVA